MADLDKEAVAAANAPGAPRFATSHFLAFTDSSFRSLLRSVTSDWAPMRLAGAALLVVSAALRTSHSAHPMRAGRCLKEAALVRRHSPSGN